METNPIEKRHFATFRYIGNIVHDSKCDSQFLVDPDNAVIIEIIFGYDISVDAPPSTF